MTMHTQCTHCKKHTDKVGLLWKYRIVGKRNLYRLCQRCRWLHGVINGTPFTLLVVNHQLARHNQPLVTMQEYGILSNKSILNESYKKQ